jgi:hypothetical protein
VVDRRLVVRADPAQGDAEVDSRVSRGERVVSGLCRLELPGAQGDLLVGVSADVEVAPDGLRHLDGERRLAVASGLKEVGALGVQPAPGVVV